MSGKFDASAFLIKHHATIGDKIVAFSREKKTVNMLHEKFRDYADIGAVKITGDSSMDERSASMNIFKSNFEWLRCHLLATTFAVSSEGINLTAANVVILMDVPWSAAEAKQAISRYFQIFFSSQKKRC